ncbi:hypothetical protein BJX70DRAFT_386295 [Aspergillus crustosus]
MATERTRPYFKSVLYHFLDSETVALQAAGSRRRFHIHRDLLAHKSKTIAAGLGRGFKEGRQGSTQTNPREEIKKEINGAEEAESSDKVQKRDSESQVPLVDLAPENHPLLAHIRLYVFCTIYLIPDLQQLSFSRITVTTQLCVIAGLRVSFRKLMLNDPLLDWLGQFAAYNARLLRVQRDFHDLLQECPNLGSRMVLSLDSAQSPPWQTAPPKYEFGHYTPGYHYDGVDEEL